MSRVLPLSYPLTLNSFVILIFFGCCFAEGGDQGDEVEDNNTGGEEA